MAVKSLKVASAQGAFTHLCNSCGEVFDPNDLSRSCSLEELPGLWTQEEISLFQDGWSDNLGVNMHILRLSDGTAAMGLNYLFDTCWCMDILEHRNARKGITEKEVKETWMPKLFHAVSEAAERGIQKVVPDYDIYIGRDTDPDGHELMVVIPYGDREKIKETADKLYYAVYQAVEELFG